MPKPDRTLEVGPETQIKMKLGAIASLIAAVAAIVAGAYGFHHWINTRLDQHEQKLDSIEVGNSNILYAVRKCWSVEDQQNWTDDIERTQPNVLWPRPNDIIRKRLTINERRP